MRFEFAGVTSASGWSRSFGIRVAMPAVDLKQPSACGHQGSPADCTVGIAAPDTFRPVDNAQGVKCFAAVPRAWCSNAAIKE